MKDIEREISKELYDESIANGGYIPRDKRREFFGMSILMGYGLYDEHFIEKNGKYYIRYSIGDSCD